MAGLDCPCGHTTNTPRAQGEKLFPLCFLLPARAERLSNWKQYQQRDHKSELKARDSNTDCSNTRPLRQQSWCVRLFIPVNYGEQDGSDSRSPSFSQLR